MDKWLYAIGWVLIVTMFGGAVVGLISTQLPENALRGHLALGGLIAALGGLALWMILMLWQMHRDTRRWAADETDSAGC